MKHLVIEDVFKEPARDERLIEKWMNPNDTVFFLNRAEDEVLARPLLPSPTPHNAITTKTSPKVPLIHTIENRAQIKIAAFVPEVEMPLHRQQWSGQFSFCFFLCHHELLQREKNGPSVYGSPDELTRTGAGRESVSRSNLLSSKEIKFMILRMTRAYWTSVSSRSSYASTAKIRSAV